jgi:hypothetical protein
MPSPVTAELRADISHYMAGMTKAKGEMEKLVSEGSSKMGALQSVISSKMASMSQNVGTSLAGLSGGTAIAATAVAAGIGAVASFVEHGVAAFAALTGQVTAYQRVTGASAEESSRMVGVMRDLGVDAETGARAMQKFGATIAMQPEKLKEFGVEVARNKNGTVDMVGTIANLGDVYRRTGDATQQAAMRQQLMGRGGLALAPILAKNREELEAFAKAAQARGEIFSQDDLQRGAELRVSLRELHDSMEGLAIAAGKTVVPAVTAGAHAMSFAADHSRILGAALASQIPILGLLGLHHGHVAKAAHDQAVQDEETALMEKQAADAEKEHAQQLRQLQSVVESSMSAHKAYEQAQRAVGDAERTVGDRQAALNDLLRKGAVDAKAVEAAQRGLASANRSLQSATEAAAQAQKDLDAVLHPTARSLTDAQLAVNDASRGVERSALAVTDAQTALNAAYASGDPEQVQKAQLDLAAAQDEVTRAQEAQGDAKKALDDMLHPERTDAAATAQRRLNDATMQVADATQAQRDATARLDEAQKGDPEFADKVAMARRGVADAERQVADAKDRVSDAALKMAEAQAAENDALQAAGGLTAELRTSLDAIAAANPEAQATVSTIEQLMALGATSASSSPLPSAHVGNVRLMASGGIVRARPGGTLVRVGEAGQDEVVIPLRPGGVQESSKVPMSSSHGGGGDINLYVTVQVAGNVWGDVQAAAADLARPLRSELARIAQSVGGAGNLF